MFDDQQKKNDVQDQVEDIFEGLDSGVPSNLPMGDTAPAPQAAASATATDAAPAQVNNKPAEDQAAPLPTSHAAPKVSMDMPMSKPDSMPNQLSHTATDSDPTKKPESSNNNTAQPSPSMTMSGAKPLAPSAQHMQSHDLGKKKTGHGMAIFIVILAIVIIGVAAYIAYSLVFQNPFEPGAAIEALDDSSGADADIILPNDQDTQQDEPEPVPAVAVDTDGDGLTDAEEATVGSDPTLPDTDGDGLFDREEVRVYNTDPLNEDTDGDGFLDGAEVENGYSPNGPGRLFVPPTQN